MRRDSRSLILTAARAEFAANGYAGARVNRIARRAGVNKQLLFYYFGSKAGVYRAVLDVAASEMAETPRAAASAALRDTLVTAFKHLIDRPESISLIAHAARSGERITPSVSGALSQPWRQIRDTISAGQGVGLIRDDVDPDSLALQAVVLLVGFLALEPVLQELPYSTRREVWASAVADSFTRILAW